MPAHSDIPFTLVGLDHVVFLVDNMDVALDFYRGVLGCQDGYSYPALGMQQVWCGSALIVLWDVTHPGAASAVPPVAGGRNVDHVCFRVEPFDAEALRRHLAAHGVEAGEVESRYGAEGEGPSIYLNDPEGNTVELKGPPWPEVHQP